MAPDDHDNPDSTGYEYFNDAVVIYFRAHSYCKAEGIKKKAEPIWLKGRKNKRDNFKLK